MTSDLASADVAEPDGTVLSRMIRSARLGTTTPSGRPLTQAELAAAVGRQHQQVSQIETGRVLPALDLLARIHGVLRAQAADGRTPEDLSVWLVEWLGSQAERAGDSAVLPELTSAVERLRTLAERRGSRRGSRGQPAALASIADFPGDDRFTIILGDRREWRAKSAADCLIYPGSTTDSMYLGLFGDRLDRAEIYTDKLLARLPAPLLRDRPELAERNLLVLGSPAANWGARILNRAAVFPFRIDDDVMKRSAELIEEPRMQDPSFASAFWKLAQAVRPGTNQIDHRQVSLDEDEKPHSQRAEELVHRILGGSTARAMMNKFRALGILDPADQENHGTNIHPANDFAVVTLARNPFAASDRYRAVICAGVHGPGTASAVRALATNAENLFANRPLGGVLEVRLNLDLAWSERIPKATISVQTQEYDSRAVLARMEKALAQPLSERGAAFKPWDQDSLRESAAFVGAVVGG